MSIRWEIFVLGGRYITQITMFFSNEICSVYRNRQWFTILLDTLFTLFGGGSVFAAWWRHQMETFYALLAICAENSPVSGEFPAQRPVTRRVDVSFDLCLNKRVRKQSWGWWFETLSCPLWRHCNVVVHSLWGKFNTLQWRHNERNETSKPRGTGLSEGNPPVDSPSQKASNAENVSIWWDQHVCTCSAGAGPCTYICLAGHNGDWLTRGCMRMCCSPHVNAHYYQNYNI